MAVLDTPDFVAFNPLKIFSPKSTCSKITDPPIIDPEITHAKITAPR